MALSAHLLLSGRSQETIQGVSINADGPLSSFAFVLDRVLQSAGDHLQGAANSDASVANVDHVNSLDELEVNVKHLICTANDDFLAHRPRATILEKYKRVLSLLGISEHDDDEALRKAACQYAETRYPTHVVGGLFFAADKALSLRDYRLARVFILLDEKVRSLETDQQYGFSKYLTEFMHNFTLAKALMQLDRIDEAEKIVKEWANSAQTYELPQDTTGRTLGSLLVSRVFALYALLLNLSGNTAESYKWWQLVLERSECFSVICELCADRLEVQDSNGVQAMLDLLSEKILDQQKTGDIVFFWWLLNRQQSAEAESVLEIAQSKSDFLACLSDFASMEILGQRHNCADAEELLKLICHYLDGAHDNYPSVANDYLLNVYLGLALEYKQAGLVESAEKNFKNGLALIDSILDNTLEADPRKQMKLNYVRSEFVREHDLFLQEQNRQSE